MFDNTPELFVCKRCQVLKPSLDFRVRVFYTKSSRKEYQQHTCKACDAERMKVWGAARKAKRVPLTPPGMKWCPGPGCKTYKPISDFGSDVGRKDGLASLCRQCIPVVSRELYSRNLAADQVRSKLVTMFSNARHYVESQG